MRNSIQNLAKLGVLAAASIAIPAAAQAEPQNALQNGWYGGVSGDLTWLRNSNTGAGGNIDLGYQFGDFRLEGEAGYHSAGGRDGFSNTHYFTYMGNVYFDLKRWIPSTEIAGWAVGPYIGGGLGDAQIHYGSSSFVNTYHHNHSEFAYEGMAGLTFTTPSMPNTDWRIGYRYVGTDNTNIHANNLELGLNVHF